MPGIIDNLDLNFRELKNSYAQQLPTIAALIYCSQDDPDPDEAAKEAVDLVDSLLSLMVEEISRRV